ncbi:MAG: CPBP family intramembrane metalloprotease, partial [Solobacterium sp.]|nr:CPBP family intramembrane metalloprotease [Solobacterium sp.]
QFFLAFLLGALFAVVYLRTGKIIYTMILHAMINLTATIPNFLQMAGITIDTEFMIGIFVLAAIGWAVILFGRKHLPKFPEQSEVPDATRATWKNVGMMLARILGLVSLVSTDLLMMTMSIISSGSALPLLKLIPITLAILTVLLLPGWTRRFEKNTAAEDCQETPQAE